MDAVSEAVFQAYVSLHHGDELTAATRMSDLMVAGFDVPLFEEARSPDDIPENRTQQ